MNGGKCRRLEGRRNGWKEEFIIGRKEGIMSKREGIDGWKVGWRK